MGIGYKTTSHYNFSANIQKGDFIAIDEDNNGQADHMGFVVARDSYSDNYSGKTYYDYKVAQHTNNYCAWTSSSANGWENAENNGQTYFRVRR